MFAILNDGGQPQAFAKDKIVAVVCTKVYATNNWSIVDITLEGGNNYSSAKVPPEAVEEFFDQLKEQ